MNDKLITMTNKKEHIIIINKNNKNEFLECNNMIEYKNK
jgi:hypothetical protein